MADDLVHKIGVFGGRLKMNGAEVGRKMTSGMNTMSFKMKGFFQGQSTQEDKIVDDTEAECLKYRGEEKSFFPDFPPKNLEVLQMFTAEQTKEAFDMARVSIELLSTVLSSTQQDALEDDALTGPLVDQCHNCQFTVQKIIETSLSRGYEGESVLFEALNLSEELGKILVKYRECVQVDKAETKRMAGGDCEVRMLDDEQMMDELDKIIFGNKEEWSSADDVHYTCQNNNNKCRILTA